MKILWLPGAERSRDRQLAYIAERNPEAAIRMGDAVRAAVLQLVAHPYLGRPGRVKNTRELVVSGTPYAIGYFIRPDAVIIARVLRASQRWPAKF